MTATATGSMIKGDMISTWVLEKVLPDPACKVCGKTICELQIKRCKICKEYVCSECQLSNRICKSCVGVTA